MEQRARDGAVERQQAALQRRAELLARATAGRLCHLPRGSALFDRDDAVSVALIAATEACRSYDGSAKFDTHIIFRVRVAVLEAFRKEEFGALQTRSGKHSYLCPLSIEKVKIGDDEDGRTLKVADTMADPRLPDMHEGVTRAETLKVLRWLPRAEAFVLVAYYLEQRTHKEIGKLLGRSESRIHQIHRQGLDRARGMLGGQIG